MTKEEHTRYIIDKNTLPDKFPTQRHSAEFWESLGRAVATFGFLEEVLTKAIFSFTSTEKYTNMKEVEQAFSVWVPMMERTLSDSLKNLIDTYGKAVHDNPEATILNLDELLKDLLEASKIRNILCHGSWDIPDSSGASLPFFVNRQKEIFQTPIDCSFINKVQKHVTELICEVIMSVTYMGWQFPGSKGPGEIIWNKKEKS